MTEKDWIIQYDKKEVGKRSYGQESLMSLGNGYLGLRGAPLWSTCSDNHYPGLYVAGVFNRTSTEVAGHDVINEDMVFGRTLYPVTCVNIGNPHCVIPMREISKPLVTKIGDYAEIARYFPNRINTQIMKVIDKENIAIEIFERGAGYTLASGTGACAAAGVAYKLGMTNSKVIVHMPGGELQVEVEDDWNVYMTGDVFYVAKMTLSNEFAEKLRAL